MTSAQRSLFPASGDDRGALLRTLELVACSGMQFGQIVGAVVSHGMSLEPGPQVLDRIEVGRNWWQECDLDIRDRISDELAIPKWALAIESEPTIRLDVDLVLPEGHELHPELALRV